eukprot:SAG31_NODE_793_length_12044_cov_12.886229_17_plen_340_part_00
MPSGGNVHWFETEFGAPEPRSFAACKQMFTLSEDKQTLTSKANGREFHVGHFSTPSVKELRDQLAAAAPFGSQAGRGAGLTFKNIVGSAGPLHLLAASAGAVFQAASQFNCLEMVSPGDRPEDGITRYALDHTQGPACAIACPAGTVYRNYFHNGGQAGGYPAQIDLAADAAALLSASGIENGKHQVPYWKMSNGYLMPAYPAAMADIAVRLCQPNTGSAPLVVDSEPAAEVHADPKSTESCSASSLASQLVGTLRVGVHWTVAVAGNAKAGGAARHRVCQVYTSAVPVCYLLSTVSAYLQGPDAIIETSRITTSFLLVGGLCQVDSVSRLAAFRNRVP